MFIDSWKATSTVYFYGICRCITLYIILWMKFMDTHLNMEFVSIYDVIIVYQVSGSPDYDVWSLKVQICRSTGPCLYTQSFTPIQLPLHGKSPSPGGKSIWISINNITWCHGHRQHTSSWWRLTSSWHRQADPGQALRTCCRPACRRKSSRRSAPCARSGSQPWQTPQRRWARHRRHTLGCPFFRKSPWLLQM